MRVALTTACLLATLCAPAVASSIFFVRDGNIWLANPDGTSQAQLTTDGTTIPYTFVSTAKVGTAPRLGFQRYSTSIRPLYGTINPDGTGYAINPFNGVMSATDSLTPSPRLSAAGDRVAYSVGYTDCGFVGCVQYYIPESVGVDGSAPALVNSVRGAYDVTFGDPAGATLLFDDVGSDYLPPAACASNKFMLVLQAPQPAVTNPPPLGQASFYCVNGTDLREPTLRPDGQLIAATALDGSTSRIVTLPSSGFAAGSTNSPVTALTPSDLSASQADFSPDGTEIVFQGPGNTLYTIPANGGTPTQILTNASVPAWSPYTQSAGGGAAGGGAAGGGGGGAAGGGGGGGAPAPAPPVILAARLTSTRFAVAREATAVSATARRGTTIRLTLSAPAKLEIAITRAEPGVRRGRRCVTHPRTRASGRPKVCERAVAVSTLTRSHEPQGLDAIRFSGRVGNRALSPGSYKAILTASNEAGRSTPVTLAFTIVRKSG